MFLKRPELSRKEMKNLRIQMKTSLGARIGSRKPKKRVQNAPEHESTFGAQEYHSALLECRIALFWALAQFPSGVDKAHPF